MTEAYIYDSIRTPRGRGKKTGSLNEVKAIDLLAGLFRALRKRHGDFDTTQVDDVVLGCVTPLGEQGGDIAKLAMFTAVGTNSTRHANKPFLFLGAGGH